MSDVHGITSVSDEWRTYTTGVKEPERETQVIEPERMTVKCGLLEITSDGPSHAHVTLDGVPLKNCTDIVLRCGVGEVHTLTATVLLLDEANPA